MEPLAKGAKIAHSARMVAPMVKDKEMWVQEWGEKAVAETHLRAGKGGRAAVAQKEVDLVGAARVGLVRAVRVKVVG